MAIQFNKIDKLIEITSPQASVSIQDIVNAVRDWEDELVNLDVEPIISASGKQSLGGGISVGITLELINDWRIEFAARAGPDYVSCLVSGGNLVATNIYGNNPIKASAYTQITIAQSASAISSVADASGLVADIADAVMEEKLLDHSIPDSLAEAILRIQEGSLHYPNR